MALLVDGNPSQVTDLSNYESSIVEVAATEGIDLTAKLTVAALEVGLELQRFLVNAPGGQLVQATDTWVGVRNARIVLLCDSGARARMSAAWRNTTLSSS